MKIKNVGLALTVAGLGVMSQISVAQALTWNWSYSTVSGVNAGGEWVTDGTTATVGNMYTIQSISGNRNNVLITGLKNNGSGDQKFTYDGNTFIPNFDGIEYNITGSTTFYNIANTDSIQPGLGSGEYVNAVGSQDDFTSSSLTVASVPLGFLPNLGTSTRSTLVHRITHPKEKTSTKISCS